MIDETKRGPGRRRMKIGERREQISASLDPRIVRFLESRPETTSRLIETAMLATYPEILEPQQ